MRFVAVLNRDGGSLRTADLEALTDMIDRTLGKAGHAVDVNIVRGDGLVAALDKAARSRADIVLCGGGDGTVSAAAARLMRSRKALAVLPAGTMNLFARSLGIPLGLEAAVEALADAQVKAVDVATANGRPFVHQFSVGMHARMVRQRERMQFGSRLSKIGASARAAWNAIRNPPTLTVNMLVGDAEIVARTTGIGVTNNLFGEGHLPYAEHPDGGVLGVYVTVAERPSEIASFLLNMARGRWRANEQVEIHQADRVVLRVKQKRGRKLGAAIDGELIDLEAETELCIHPGALRVLAPARAASSKAA